MNEWQVFLVIGAVVSFLIAIITPMLKLNTAIVRLIEAVNTLELSLGRLTKSNSESHKRIWCELEKQDDVLNNHENRINLLEQRRHDK